MSLSKAAISSGFNFYGCDEIQLTPFINSYLVIRDKAKLSARIGRKVAGLEKIAGLP